MKIFYKLLILIIIAVSILAYIEISIYEVNSNINPQMINSDFNDAEENLVERKDELEVSDVISLDSIFPLNNMYKVENGKGTLYTLSYIPEGNILEKGSKIQYVRAAGDQVYLILRESYPNVSLDEMGVTTIEEAYQATQLAIWEVALRTGESTYGSELSKIQSIKNDMGYKNINSKVFESAERLVKMIEDYNSSDTTQTVDMFPKPFLKTNGALTDGNIVGPFYYDLSLGLITDVEIEFVDENENVLTDMEVVDSTGARIVNLENTNEFYIKYKGEKHNEVIYTLKIKYNRIQSSVYKDSYSDYILNSYFEEENEISGKITR